MLLLFEVFCTCIVNDNIGSYYPDRNQSNGGSSDFCMVSDGQEVATQHGGKHNFVKPSGKVDKTGVFCIERDDGIPGPETPVVRPLVPRLKRVQEEGPMPEDKCDGPLLGSSKRMKMLEDSMLVNKNQKEADMPSKFEWLDPSRIRDANKRRPDDPLYDKSTLYVPPDVLTKMSASQKQYWNIKCQYMDVVLFFKVVS